MCNHPEIGSRRKFLQLAAGTVLALPVMSAQADTTKTVAPIIDLPKPGTTDACPVCGMFPAKYPDWVATVLFEDGHADHFDGAKDFFKYLLDMDKFASGRKKEQITGLGVTDYYATEMIDAKQAIYVIGSDVLGPMGHDLIPHPDRYDADAFMKDHKGYKLLRFDQITKSMLFGLDDGKFDQ
jgi:nitrous oxide reductase accessory protein NosL